MARSNPGPVCSLHDLPRRFQLITLCQLDVLFRCFLLLQVAEVSGGAMAFTQQFFQNRRENAVLRALRGLLGTALVVRVKGPCLDTIPAVLPTSGH